MSRLRHSDYLIRVSCAYTIFTEPRDDTTCFSSDSDLTSTAEMGHLAFVLSLAFLTLNVPKHNKMLPAGQ